MVTEWSKLPFVVPNPAADPDAAASDLGTQKFIAVERS
jgi:hypothetical protein